MKDFLFSYTLFWRILISVCLLLFTNYTSIANCHYIVAIDVAYSDSGKKSLVRGEFTREAIFTILEKNGYCADDYLSIVSYAISVDNPDFATFVTAAEVGTGTKMTWMQYENAKCASESMKDNWSQISTDYHTSFFSNGRIASLQSLSKQYILKALKSDDKQKVSGSIVLLMVTDGIVNGIDDDYKQEYNNVFGSERYENDKRRALRNEVFNFARECNNKFRFDRITILDASGQNTEDVSLNYGNMKIVPYAVYPTVIPSIHSITDVPSPLPFKKVRGGFILNMDVNTYSDMYSVESMYLNLNKQIFSNDAPKCCFNIEREFLADGDTLSFGMTVKYNDGIYNGLILSSKQVQYRQGLEFKQKFRIQQDSKIFGLVTLPDSLWWFYRYNISAAITLWDIILTLIGIIILCILFFKLFRKVTLYIPNNKEIHLKFAKKSSDNDKCSET